jgi:hypothetical protein
MHIDRLKLLGQAERARNDIPTNQSAGFRDGSFRLAQFD